MRERGAASGAVVRASMRERPAASSAVVRAKARVGSDVGVEPKSVKKVVGSPTIRLRPVTGVLHVGSTPTKGVAARRL